MYDKLILKVDGGADKYPHLLQLLDSAKQQVKVKTGEVTTFGYCRNIKVTIYPDSINLTGSIAKFFHHGSNVLMLDRHTTEEALQMLADTLHLPIAEAQVKNLEIGANFYLTHKPAEYLKRLGEMPKRVRYPYNADTLYYHHKGRDQPDEFIMYDKIADAKAKRMEIPREYKNLNFLRAELKMWCNQKMLKSIGVPELRASTLYERNFYLKLKDIFIQKYFSIKRVPKLSASFISSIDKPGDAVDAFLGLLLDRTGDPAGEIAAYINELKNNRVFKNRLNYGRTKDMISRGLSKAKLTEKDVLRDELDNEFLNLKLN